MASEEDDGGGSNETAARSRGQSTGEVHCLASVACSLLRSGVSGRRRSKACAIERGSEGASLAAPHAAEEGDVKLGRRLGPDIDVTASVRMRRCECRLSRVRDGRRCSTELDDSNGVM